MAGIILQHYPGAVLIVSHDRYFIDRIVTKVFELEQSVLTTYTGNYSDYAKSVHRCVRQNQSVSEPAAGNTSPGGSDRQTEIFQPRKIRQACGEPGENAGKNRSAGKTPEVNDEMRLILEPCIQSGNDVLSVESLSKSYPGLRLFHDLSFRSQRGERIAVIGANGTGKTTILKILNQLVEPDAGASRWKQRSYRLLRPGTSCARHGKDHISGNLRCISRPRPGRGYATCSLHFYLPETTSFSRSRP